MMLEVAVPGLASKTRGGALGDAASGAEERRGNSKAKSVGFSEAIESERNKECAKREWVIDRTQTKAELSKREGRLGVGQ